MKVLTTKQPQDMSMENRYKQPSDDLQIATTVLRPFFTYYGGKYRLAPKYPRPKYDVIIEPFCGSAGYSVRYPDRKIKLYDINPKICAIWNWLIKVKELDFLKIPVIFEDIRELSVSEEVAWFLGFWVNKGSANPKNKMTSWVKSGLRPKSSWGDFVKTLICSQLKYIRHWKCENKSYYDVVNEEASWFIDPPYCGLHGRYYLFNEVDYKVLKGFCETRLGQVIVCEGDGAAWMDFRDFAIAKSQSGKNKEKIWTK